MKIKILLLSFFCMMLFTAITHAQCTSASIKAAELTAGQKVILAEISKEDNPELHKAMVGKTLTVGTGGMANIGDCWFLGELNISGEDVFFVSVRLDAVTSENYGTTTPPAEIKAISDFPVGAKVSVSAFQELNKYCPQSLSDRPESVSGEVVESDLVKDENGNYSGCVMQWGTKHCFKGAKVY